MRPDPQSAIENARETVDEPEQSKQLIAALINEEFDRADIAEQLVSRLADSAGEHGIAGLLFDRLLNLDPSQLALCELRDTLKPSAYRNAMEEAGFAGIEQKLVDALDAAGINALMIKGSALSRLYYEKPWHRTRRDIDIFIGLNQIEATADCLRSAGFQITSLKLKSHQFQAAVPDNAGVIRYVDIHWRIQNHPQFARCLRFEDAWSASRPLPGLPAARTLSPAHTLLLACVHFIANPEPRRMAWLYDIHRILTTLNPKDWADFKNNVKSAGHETVVGDALMQTGRYFPITEESSRYAQSILSKSSAPVQLSYLSLVRADFHELPSLSLRLRLLCELLWPGTDYFRQQRANYSSWLLPFYWLSYLSRGLRRHT